MMSAGVTRARVEGIVCEEVGFFLGKEGGGKNGILRGLRVSFVMGRRKVLEVVGDLENKYFGYFARKFALRL